MNNLILRIIFKSFNFNLIYNEMIKIIEIVYLNGSNIRGPVCLPTKIEKFTLLTSPHTHKDSRDQYEIRTYKRFIDIIEPNEKIIESLMHIDLIAGVDINISVH
ncbi:30S ribosomal protein S10 [Candidatus Annandia adelgestsuga]|uniref:Small ribosomal subunit protein uS10 n=1 Tax=Candidatus Annandia adelgestsuga TaxID=1302411 RepID=A0A3Q9CLB0_9ENTR|nr:30S ribosomal protein S10 [Candidatus Annandia adelgestsuga]AZP36223.1 30S ribosomal protein S10 [Candidatus Annandia adelgestsuga]